MPRRSALARRTRKEWAVRGALALLAAVLGYVSVIHTAAAVAARRNAELAHRLAPGNGAIAARLALSLAGVEATTTDRQRADVLARRALLRDATAVPAVVTLGVNAEIRGERAKARRLFAYSQALSRRDLQTQFWAIEDAVGRDDVAEVLRHYDIALRTSVAGSGILFPLLATAASDPAVRSGLIKILAARPNWSESFIGYVAGNGPDPRSTAALFLGLRHVGVAVPKTTLAPLVNALVAGGFMDDAWRYYASATPGVDRSSSRDPEFAFGMDTPSLFDWVPINDGTVTTSIQRGDESGVFDFAAPASVGGVLLQQLQLLQPGTYRIAGSSSGIEQEESARPYWVLSCRQDGRELGRVPLPNSAEANGRFTGIFTVPPGCPVQTLALVARPSDAVAGLSGQINRVQLTPVRVAR